MSDHDSVRFMFERLAAALFDADALLVWGDATCQRAQTARAAGDAIVLELSADGRGGAVVALVVVAADGSRRVLDRTPDAPEQAIN